MAILTTASNKLRVLGCRTYFAVFFQNLRGIKKLVLIKIFGVRHLGGEGEETEQNEQKPNFRAAKYL